MSDRAQIDRRFARAVAVFGLFFDRNGLEIATLKHNRSMVHDTEDCPPYLVSFSHSQQCFHIESLASELRRNIAVCIEDRPGSYFAVALCHSHEDARDVVSRLKAARVRLKNARKGANDEEGEDHE